MALGVTPAQDFSLSLNPTSLTLVQGMSADVAVTVARAYGHTSAISVTMDNPPYGVTGSLLVPEGATSGTLTVTAAFDAAVGGPLTLAVKGDDGIRTRQSSLALTVGAPAVILHSASAVSAVPGTIVRLSATGSQPDATVPSDARVIFGSVSLPPVQLGKDFLTVMVPPFPAGAYSISISSASSAVPGSVAFTILEPAPADPQIAIDFTANVSTLVSQAGGAIHDACQAVTTGVADSAALDAQLQKVDGALADIQIQMASLDPAQLQLLAQMLNTSGIQARVKNAAQAFRQAQAPVSGDLARQGKYQALLSSAQPGPVSAAVFSFLVKVDMLNAVLDDVNVVLTAVEVGGLVANVIPGVGTALSGATIVVLEEVKTVIGIVDHVVHGFLPTDLKKVRMEITPDRGNILNPGETATLRAFGVLGTQSTPTAEAVGFGIDALTGGLDKLSQAIGGTTPLPSGLKDIVKDWIKNLAIDVGWDTVFSGGDFQIWIPEMQIDPGYYVTAPGTQMALSLVTLFPALGRDASQALQDAILGLAGNQDTLLTNTAITVDDPSILSFDLASGKLTALATGTTSVHFRPYRYCDLVESSGWKWLNAIVNIQWWDFAGLSEGIQVHQYGTKDGPVLEPLVDVNIPVMVSVNNDSDDVTSPLTGIAVSGAVPGIFSTDGGTFSLNVSPVDANHNLLAQGLSEDNFSIGPLDVANYSDGSHVATGFAHPDGIIIDQPQSGVPVSVAIILDSSGSMSTSDPNRDRVTAAKTLLAEMKATDQAAVFDFGAGSTSGFNYTRLLQGFTTDRTLLGTAIDQATAYNDTPLYESLQEVLTYMVSNGATNPVILVLTDGLANSDTLFAQDVAQAQAAGIPIYAVGLGSNIDFSELQALATQTSGSFASVVQADALQQLFANIGITLSAGHISVQASGFFLPPLTNAGLYTISGALTTRYQGASMDTPFSFTVNILPAAQARSIRMIQMKAAAEKGAKK
jgi:hypothetical protein